jgi:predicted nuclease of restriction endonuclease-like (RecB) superfamily
MVQFAQAFPQPEIVATLSRPLNWSHFVNLLSLKTEPARQFYASQAATNTWSVRGLRHPIDRKAFERTELAALQTHTPVQAELVEAANTAPAQVFKDPYFLDFLGLRQGHDEADLEAAILRQLEAFILELERGFAFVERQKRMVSASSCAPNPAANRLNCCKCTKMGSPWPNTGPNCQPRQSWSKSCTQRCLKRASGLRGVGFCWGNLMTSDDHEGQQRPGVSRRDAAQRRVHARQRRK